MTGQAPSNAPTRASTGGGPFACMTDVNCPEGAPYQDDKRAVAEGYDGAFICSGQMAVAYFMAHQPKAFWPIHNGGELSAIYAFLFLFIASRGSGIWSVGGATGGD